LLVDLFCSTLLASSDFCCRQSAHSLILKSTRWSSHIYQLIAWPYPFCTAKSEDARTNYVGRII